jgi:hypothetical protein
MLRGNWPERKNPKIDSISGDWIRKAHASHKPFGYGGKSLLGGWQLAAPNEIVDLAERFESNLESNKSEHYNETSVRIVNIYPKKLLRD